MLPRSCAITLTANRACTRTKAGFIRQLAEFDAHKTVKHSIENMCATKMARRSTPIQRKATSHFQAWHAGRLSALQREALASLSGGIRFPLQSPHRAWLQRWRPCGACREERGWQAPHVSGNSRGQILERRRSGLFAGGKSIIQAALDSTRISVLARGPP